MPEIRVLSREVAELIAAGEVIERPASIVKELVENAIDAGSTSIAVEIQGGGARSIRVTDNGCGISPADAPKAFLRHATSKVQLADDLDNIGTLGFRGEALASIAAVSRVEMMTRPKELEMGTLVTISGAEGEAEAVECGCPAGTTIVVRDLFYNVPARLKFLKKDVSEANAVASIVDKIALSHPDISFQFIREGKMIYRTPGDGDLMAATYTLFGREFPATLIPVDYEFEGIRVQGLCCRPTGCRARRNMQFFFINGRYTQSKTCTAALEQSYAGMMMVGKYPACVLNLTMSPESVDVNVHPAKIEVRFVNERMVFHAVYFAVKSAVTAADALSGIQTQKKDSEAPKKTPEQASFIQMPEEPAANLSPAPAEKPAPAAASQQAAKPVSLPKASVPAERLGKSLPPVLNAPAPELPAPEKEPAVPDAEIIPEETISDEPPAEADAPAERLIQTPGEWLPPRSMDARLDVEADPDDFEEELLPAGKEKLPEEVPQEQTPPSFTEQPAAEQNQIFDTSPKPKVFGEIFTTYILAQIGDEFVIVDKHAAHERMLYNRLAANHRHLDRQMLLVSMEISLTRQEHQAVLENLSLFGDLGFEVEDFGGNTVLLRAIPALVGDVPPGELFGEAVSGLMDAGRKNVPLLDEILHRMACHSAVRSGDRNTREELQEIVETICEDESVRYCPHGRPVMIRYSRKMLEKLFGRIQ